jgi:hypothetical protein
LPLETGVTTALHRPGQAAVYEFHCEIMNITDDIELPYMNYFTDEPIQYDSEHVSRHNKWWGGGSDNQYA